MRGAVPVSNTRGRAANNTFRNDPRPIRWRVFFFLGFFFNKLRRPQLALSYNYVCTRTFRRVSPFPVSIFNYLLT